MKTVKRAVVARVREEGGRKRWNTEDFSGSETTLYGTKWGMHVMHLPEPTECTPPRLSLKVNYGLWNIVKCQCRFISVNKCTTPLGAVDTRDAVHM